MRTTRRARERRERARRKMVSRDYRFILVNYRFMGTREHAKVRESDKLKVD